MPAVTDLKRMANREYYLAHCEEIKAKARTYRPLFEGVRTVHDPALWELPDGSMIRLITESELDRLSHGWKLISISGKQVEVGKDYIDRDERFGYLAYGFTLKEAGIRGAQLEREAAKHFAEQKRG